MLAQNAPSQSEALEARQAIPGCTQVDKLSQSSMGGNTLDKREATDPRGNGNVRTTEGNIRSRNNQDHRTTHAAGS